MINEQNEEIVIVSLFLSVVSFILSFLFFNQNEIFLSFGMLLWGLGSVVIAFISSEDEE